MKTDTLIFYPFRLEEAKLNKGNVVTRDGKPWQFLALNPHYFEDCVLKGKYDGMLSYWCEDGRFYVGQDFKLDLFMTTPPEDKPAPPKAAEEVDGPTEINTQLEKLEEAKKAHTWIPVSERMPTEADADEDGYVWTLDLDMCFCRRPWNDGWMSEQRFWMTPIPLPTPPDESEAYDKWEQEQGDGIHMGDKRTLIKAAFLAGQASREGGTK